MAISQQTISSDQSWGLLITQRKKAVTYVIIVNLLCVKKLHKEHFNGLFSLFSIFFFHSFPYFVCSSFVPSFPAKLPSVCLEVSIPQLSPRFPGGQTVNTGRKKSTCVCYKSDIYARRVLERKDRQLTLDSAVVCGFLRATWEAFKCRSGTDSR